MGKLNIFKVSYNWYEGEHKEILLSKRISTKEFEKDLIEAKDFAKSLIGKGYTVECLPEFYEQIIRFLIQNKKYIECEIENDIEYYIDDCSSENKIIVNKKINKIEIEELSKEN